MAETPLFANREPEEPQSEVPEIPAEMRQAQDISAEVAAATDRILAGRKAADEVQLIGEPKEAEKRPLTPEELARVRAQMPDKGPDAS